MATLSPDHPEFTEIIRHRTRAALSYVGSFFTSAALAVYGAHTVLSEAYDRTTTPNITALGLLALGTVTLYENYRRETTILKRLGDPVYPDAMALDDDQES